MDKGSHSFRQADPGFRASSASIRARLWQARHGFFFPDRAVCDAPGLEIELNDSKQNLQSVQVESETSTNHAFEQIWSRKGVSASNMGTC